MKGVFNGSSSYASYPYAAENQMGTGSFSVELTFSTTATMQCVASGMSY